MSNATAVEGTGERLTWDAVCRRHPDEWVVLIVKTCRRGVESGGILGLSFLRELNYEIRSPKRRIRVGRAG